MVQHRPTLYNAKPIAMVPIHSLGVSQIIAYGLLFYVFALLKTPLASAYQVTENYVLTLLSITIAMQAFLAPIFGYWADKFSALRVMVGGLVAGGAGLVLLGAGEQLAFLYLGFMCLSLGIGGATYELAFSAAVQLNESKSRKNISYITFYGAVASSLTWIAVEPMLERFGLAISLYLLGGVVGLMALRLAWLAHGHSIPARQPGAPLPRFRWSQLPISEKVVMVLLGTAGGAGYLGFGAAAMMWISWFDMLYGSASFAVLLASIYGPFQLVGRYIEMVVGSRFDARLTGAIASLLVPFSVFFAQFEHPAISMLAMALFGMGHGVTTVTYGFVTNLYFRSEVYGRAKGWISMPKTLGLALGPVTGGMLYAQMGSSFLWCIIALSSITSLALWAILSQRPTNDIHQR